MFICRICICVLQLCDISLRSFYCAVFTNILLKIRCFHTKNIEIVTTQTALQGCIPSILLSRRSHLFPKTWSVPENSVFPCFKHWEKYIKQTGHWFLFVGILFAERFAKWYMLHGWLKYQRILRVLFFKKTECDCFINVFTLAIQRASKVILFSILVGLFWTCVLPLQNFGGNN